MRCLKSITAAAALALAVAAYAQDPRATITGHVTDNSGAAIPQAEVRATNLETGVSVSTHTNASGVFNLPFLLPGNYRVASAATGFRNLVRENVELRVADTVEIDLEMQVGGTTESVEVKATAPPLETATASLAQVVDSKRINDLPLFGGNPTDFVRLSPGITAGQTSGKANATNTQITSDGNGSRSNEFQIDGVSNTFAIGGQMRPAFNPPAAAVGEFRVQTATYDASVGHSTGVVVNVSTTSGTNQPHGEAHWWVRNKAFDAADFFNNANGTKPPVYQDNRYGASFGGPVRIPKLYDGRNKTFFFYAWEANKFGLPRTYTETVPTPAEARGDFSALLKLPNGSAYQIYDPATTKAEANGRFSRQPFPNNIIPANRLDPVGQKLVSLYAAPNQPGTADGRLNFFSAGKEVSDYYVHMARVDHNFTENHRAFVRVHYDFFQNDKDDNFQNGVNGILVNHNNRGIALDDVMVLSPSAVLNLRYGLTHNEFPQRRRSTGTDLAALGFSPSLTNLLDPSLATVPRIQMAGFSTLSNWQDGDGTETSLTHSFLGSVSQLRGAHTLRYGAEFRVYRAFRNRYSRSAAPDFVFSNTYTRGPFDNSPAAPFGQELAAMLLGIPGGAMEFQASSALQDKFLAGYIQDDWKISRTLTLNLGLRYEWEAPITERFDRLVAGFDPNAVSPVAAQAQANYARRPIPEIPAGDFQVRGGLTFLNANGVGRSPFATQKGNFLPRFGLAWQITPGTVLRGGYGIYFESLGVNSIAAIQSGFSQVTPIEASYDSGLSFAATTANPFPNGLLPPPGPAGGLATNLGQAVQFYNRDLRRPYAQRWSLGLQRQLPLLFTLDASYVGNRGTRLFTTRQLNATPAQYLSTSPVRDQKTIDFLSASSRAPSRV
jgi:hypothetical protein